MKQIIFFLLIFNLNNYNSIAHNQDVKPVHQRIVVEAYKLLKMQLSKEENGFADMDQYIGEAELQNIYYWYNVYSVAGGSDHEDRQDIIYGNSGPFGW